MCCGALGMEGRGTPFFAYICYFYLSLYGTFVQYVFFLIPQQVLDTVALWKGTTDGKYANNPNPT
jgi:hypothetical protein